MKFPVGLTVTPTQARLEEVFEILRGGKEECRYFGMAVQVDIRDYLLSSGINLTLFEDLYAADWALGYTLYDVKCSEESGNSHTVTARERILWDKHLANSHEVIIWSAKRNGDSATLIREIPYSKVRLLPSHKKEGSWYFFLNSI